MAPMNLPTVIAISTALSVLGLCQTALERQQRHLRRAVLFASERDPSFAFIIAVIIFILLS